MGNTQWTKEKIIDGVWEVVENTGIERMPTSSEVSKYYGNYKLSNAISKRKLWTPLAKELGLKVKESETAFGKRYEGRAMEHLISLGYEVEKMAQNHPYDLLVENSLKVDVKVSRLYKGSNGNFHTFNLESLYGTCDLYILYLKNKAKEDEILVIPSTYVMKNTQISVGEVKSKYHQFKDKWEYVHEIINFQKSLTKGKLND